MSHTQDDQFHALLHHSPATNASANVLISSVNGGYFTLNDLGEYEELYDPFGDTFFSDNATGNDELTDSANEDNNDENDENEYELSQDIEIESDSTKHATISREYEVELCTCLETAEITVMHKILNTLFGAIHLVSLIEKVRTGQIKLSTILRDYKLEYAQRQPADVMNEYLNLGKHLRHHVATIIELNRQLHTAILNGDPTISNIRQKRDLSFQNLQIEIQSVNLSRKYAHDLYDAFKDLYKRLETSRNIILQAERITGASYREIHRLSQAIEAGELSAEFTQNTRRRTLNYSELDANILDAIDAIRSIELSFHGSAESLMALQKSLQSPLRTMANAKNQLFCANQRLVTNIAKKYEKQGLDMEDLLQEGGCGLLKAIDRFEYRRGNRLATYAIWWIRQTISRAIVDSSRTVRLPNHADAQLKKIVEQRNALNLKLGRMPTLEELATHLNLPVKSIEQLIPFATPPESLDSVIASEQNDYIPGNEVKVSATPIELQSSIMPAIMEYTTDKEDQYRNDAEKTLADTLEDPDRDDPLQTLIRRELTEQIAEIERHLTDKEKTILNLRYGLNGETEHTLEQIGQIYNVTRERIRQIEEKAIHRLKHPVRIDMLKPYHEE